FDIAIAIVDADLRSHVRNAHITLVRVNGEQSLLRHRDVHIYADMRVSRAGRPHFVAVAILNDFRGYLLAHLLCAAFTPALHVDLAGHADFRRVGGTNGDIAPPAAHGHPRVRWDRFGRHINAAGEGLTPNIDLVHPRKASPRLVRANDNPHQRK